MNVYWMPLECKADIVLEEVTSDVTQNQSLGQMAQEVLIQMS